MPSLKSQPAKRNLTGIWTVIWSVPLNYINLYTIKSLPSTFYILAIHGFKIFGKDQEDDGLLGELFIYARDMLLLLLGHMFNRTMCKGSPISLI